MTQWFDPDGAQAKRLREEYWSRLDKARAAVNFTDDDLERTSGVAWEEADLLGEAVVQLCAIAKALRVAPRDLVPEGWPEPAAETKRPGAVVLSLPPRRRTASAQGHALRPLKGRWFAPMGASDLAIGLLGRRLALGGRVLEAMNRKGVTSAQLALRTGLSRESIEAMVIGRGDVTFGQATLLAQALGEPPHEFLAGLGRVEEQPSSNSTTPAQPDA